MLLLNRHDDRGELVRALRATFKRLAQGTKRSAEASEIAVCIMDVARRTLCDILEEWNRDSAPVHVPPEVLASCFAFLPLEDLVVASHVSRVWRATALSFPALWADIRLSVSNSKADSLLSLALKRSGELLVNFECLDMDRSYLIRASEYDITRVLNNHMHRIRSLRWFGRADAECLSRRAPALQVLQCQGTGAVHHYFLGNRVGKLRILEVPSSSFPRSCTAVSTLSIFSATGSPYALDTADLTDLFALCPRLEELTFGRLRGITFVATIPDPPDTLRNLCLETYRDDCDILPLVTGWNLRRMDHVRIAMFLRACTEIACVVEGAEHLSIDVVQGQTSTLRTRTTTLELQHHYDDTASAYLGHLLGRHAGCLDKLQTLHIPLSVLDAFVTWHTTSGRTPDCLALPALQILEISWTYTATRVFTQYLPCITRVRECSPCLNTVKVQVSFRRPGSRSARHVDDLQAGIETSLAPLFPTVDVCMERDGILSA